MIITRNTSKLTDLPLYYTHLTNKISIENIDDLFNYIGGDCWAIIVKKNNHLWVKMNTYRLISLIGYTDYIKNEEYVREDKWRDDILIDNNKLLEEIKNGNELHIYMFGSNGYKIIAKKDNNEYTFNVYGSYNFINYI